MSYFTYDSVIKIIYQKMSECFLGLWYTIALFHFFKKGKKPCCFSPFFTWQSLELLLRVSYYILCRYKQDWACIAMVVLHKNNVKSNRRFFAPHIKKATVCYASGPTPNHSQWASFGWVKFKYSIHARNTRHYMIGYLDWMKSMDEVTWIEWLNEIQEN